MKPIGLSLLRIELQTKINSEICPRILGELDELLRCGVPHNITWPIVTILVNQTKKVEGPDEE